MFMSNIWIILQTLLLENDADLKLSVMIITDYDDNRKLSVLNELDKRIENAKVNYHDRIDRFLDRASLQHLR